MVCGKCGKEYKEEYGGCPYCGGVLEEPLLIEPEERRKLRAVRLVCAAAVLGAIAALFVILRNGSFHGTDAEIFISLQKQALLEPVLTGINQFGELSGLETEGFSDDITAVWNDGSQTYQIELKANVEPGGDEGIMNLNFMYMGLNLEILTVTKSAGELGFYAPLADNHYYVIREEALLKRLAEAGLLLEETEKMEDAQEFNLEKAVQVGKLISKYAGILSSVVKEENVTSEKQTLEIDGRKVECQVYTFQPSASDLETMFTTLLQELKEDEELQGLLYQSYIGSDGPLEFYEVEADEWFTGGRMSQADFVEEYKNVVDEALATVPQTAQRIADAGFFWSVAADGKRIHQQRIAVDDGARIVYENIGDAKSSRYDALRLIDGEEQVVFSNSFTNQNQQIQGQFLVTPLSDGEFSFVYEWNQKERSSLGIPLGNSVLTYNGAELKLLVSRNAEGGVDHELYVSEYGEEPVLLVTTSQQPSTARAPKAAPVDLSDYSLEELEELWYNVIFSWGF